MSSNDHTLEGGEGGELEAWRSIYEEERQRTAQMEKRMTVLESKMEQHEKRGEQPGSEGKEYRVTRGGRRIQEVDGVYIVRGKEYMDNQICFCCGLQGLSSSKGGVVSEQLKQPVLKNSCVFVHREVVFVLYLYL